MVVFIMSHLYSNATKFFACDYFFYNLSRHLLIWLKKQAYSFPQKLGEVMHHPCIIFPDKSQLQLLISPWRKRKRIERRM